MKLVGICASLEIFYAQTSPGNLGVERLRALPAQLRGYPLFPYICILHPAYPIPSSIARQNPYPAYSASKAMAKSRLEEARALAKSDPAAAERQYKEILSKKPGSNEAALREFEEALMELGELYKDQK